MCVFSGEKRERESESEKEKKEEREKKHESQPMVFGNGHLLHSRDCENGRRDCVCVCVCYPVMSFACVRSQCVSAHVCGCHLKRTREADAIKPCRVSPCIDGHMKCLHLI